MLLEYKTKLFSVICAFLSLFPLIINMDVVNPTQLQKYSGKLNVIFNELRLSIDGNSTSIFFIFIALCYLFNAFIKKNIVKIKVQVISLSIIYSIILIVGESYYRTASWGQIIEGKAAQEIKVLLCFMGNFIIIYFLLSWLIWYIESEKKYIGTRYIVAYSVKGIAFTWLIILLCWLPYIIVKYPGILAWDTGTVLKNYFDYNIINNWHPALQVMVFTFFINIGIKIGNENIGLYLYVLLQVFIFSGVLSYFLCYLETWAVKFGYRIFLLVLCGFLPIFPYSAMQMGTDITYTITIMIYTIFLMKLYKTECIKWYEIMFNIFLLTCTTLFRHTGIYIVVLSLVINLFFIGKNNRLVFFIIHVLPILFYLCWNSFILPEVTTSNDIASSEILNITRQQIANYIIQYGNDLSEEEMLLLNSMIDVEKVPEKYNPELVDGIRSISNMHMSVEETRQYIDLWIKLLFRHPDAYIQAAINMWYGYFYPDYNSKTKYYMFYELHNISDSAVLKIEYPELFKDGRQLLDSWWRMLYKVPVISTFFGIGIYVWMCLFSIVRIISIKKWKLVIFHIPVVLTLLVCMMSPVCGYTRYAFPIMFIMPFLFGIWFDYKM